jgi:hypothetical protein
MKKLLVKVSLIGFTLNLLASDTNSVWNDWSPTVSIQTIVADKYLAFGSGSTLYNKPTLQSDIWVGFGNGLYFNLWNSTPFERYNDNFGTEQDYGIGWAGALSSFGIKNALSDLSLDIGTTYFDEPNIFTLANGDTLYTHIKVSKPLKWCTVACEYENYSTFPCNASEVEHIGSVEASKVWSLWNNRVSISASVALAYDSGVFGSDNGLLLRSFGEIDWKITKRLSLILPQLSGYQPLTIRDKRKTDGVIASGFSYKF